MIHQLRPAWIIKTALAAGIFAFSGQMAVAQTEVRSGILQFVQLQNLADRMSTLSEGTLADLQVDPNFDGDFQLIFNDAAAILEDYTIVQRGGYFPENAGIPRDQQLTVDQAVYRVYTLDDGNQLLLYRTPAENTARYFIRESG
ncbi:MAG TPA: hypothetical protein ACFE0H_07570 [Elainellaceae cyanobacterium]